uniref:Uncharacterized protein n=1 Tax=Aegilops tauschii subsp. strangulata TaxID=200361 RepID=A0A453S8D8_AEGTS
MQKTKQKHKLRPHLMRNCEAKPRASSQTRTIKPHFPVLSPLRLPHSRNPRTTAAASNEHGPSRTHRARKPQTHLPSPLLGKPPKSQDLPAPGAVMLA